MIKEKISVRTSHKSEFIDITTKVRDFVTKHNINEGLLTVYVPHTTAGVMINESADPDVVNDVGMWLERTVPENLNYQHLEGNSPAHIKSVLIGSSVRIGVSDGKLILGTWQGIFFCEFDGPRTREVILLL
ncbi:MAG: secondary thiamine-phosphate synthase enzyme YjbQ [Candidatus Cloacimonetes bacterium]|nr:secondary thiamine-phosphate synthase enzyme YjbQ [Candidatus Cloacimonadota bacterium]